MTLKIPKTRSFVCNPPNCIWKGCDPDHSPSTPPHAPQFSHYLRDPTHTRAYTRFNAVYVFPNVGLRQLSPAVRLLIFQNQGFDRLSEFPKIREAIIVSADGWQRAGGFKTIQRRDCMALILAPKSLQCICFFFPLSPPPTPPSPLPANTGRVGTVLQLGFPGLTRVISVDFVQIANMCFAGLYYSCR